jgi:hypothetical protein
MSDQATCERCGAAGMRRTGYVAPEGWYFGAFTLAPDGDHDPGDLLIVHACSAACRDALWTLMDGHRWGAVERRVNVKSEVLRFSTNVAARLREQARRIRTGTWNGEADSELFAGAPVAGLLERTAQYLEQSAESEIETLRASEEDAGANDT